MPSNRLHFNLSGKRIPRIQIMLFLASTILVSNAHSETLSSDPFEAQRRKLADLGNKIRQLESDIEIQQKQITAQRQLQSQLKIFMTIKDESILRIQDLEIAIDEMNIYRHKENNGFFSKTNQIDLFDGPLPPGPRKIAVRARITRKTSLTDETRTSSESILTNIFTIDVPEGIFRKNIALAIVGANQSSKSLNNGTEKNISIIMEKSDIL